MNNREHQNIVKLEGIESCWRDIDDRFTSCDPENSLSINEVQIENDSKMDIGHIKDISVEEENYNQKMKNR